LGDALRAGAGAAPRRAAPPGWAAGAPRPGGEGGGAPRGFLRAGPPPPAMTQTTRRPPAIGGGGERYRAYDTPVGRGRSIWPWLLGLGLALALAAGGYFGYQKIQDQLHNARPVRVEQYTGIKLANAEALVRKD